MNSRLVASTAMVAFMLATPVLAAETAAPASAKNCAALEKQFDAALKTHAKAAKIGEAKEMRAEGGRLCASGDHAGGSAKLEMAMKDLGAKMK